MATLRFVHAADLHLDSPFTGLRTEAPPHVAQRLVNATFEAYDAIVDLCLAERVDALLVAGDVYDGANRSLRAQLRFIDGLERLDAAGIRSFVCHGNHDPLSGWQARLDFPKSCHQFGRRVEGVPLDPDDPGRATVLGVSYPQQQVTDSLVPGFKSVPRRGFSIGLLHCNVGSNPDHDPYSPCTVADLAETGIDYWALGHVHTRAVLSEQRPTVVYPGNTQGRHPNERGARGVYLVEVDDGHRVTCEFRETSVLRWEAATVDIARLQTEQELINESGRQVADLVEKGDGRDLVVRLTITGRGPLHETVRRASFAADLQAELNETWASGSPFAWCERVEVKTAAAFNRAAQLQGSGFMGDLLRLVDAARDDPDLLAQLAAPLKDLYQHARAGRVLGNQDPGPEEVRALLDEAEAACIEALS